MPVKLVYHSCFSTDRSKTVSLLQYFFVCASVVHMRRLFCNYLFLIPPSLDASGRLCFVMSEFSGYLYQYILQK